METYLKTGKSAIYRSIWNYKLSNFSLDILEYCEAPSKNLLRTMPHGSIKPPIQYMKIAGSSLGYKHYKEARAKMNKKKTFWRN